jgi:hypothetical protein
VAVKVGFTLSFHNAAREITRVGQLFFRHSTAAASKILRKTFNLAIRWRIRTGNPVAGFEGNTEALRDRHLSTEEIGRLSDKKRVAKIARTVQGTRAIPLLSLAREPIFPIAHF